MHHLELKQHSIDPENKVRVHALLSGFSAEAGKLMAEHLGVPLRVLIEAEASPLLAEKFGELAEA